ncbi:MAG: T9SS type A sorting domain-containing protein [Saprospiraceae bacterium]|nr:T9SS type A sorting domain-containing protein [Saprospiraceae bacterium]
MKTKCPTPKCFQTVLRHTTYVLSVICLLGGMNKLSAQCPLACNDLIQVSVDSNCTALVTPDMLLEAPGDSTVCDYMITLFDENDNPLPDDIIRRDQVGKTIKARVELGANSCWSLIRVEDKTAPFIECSVPDTVMCNVDNYLISNDTVIENCDVADTIIVSDEFIDFPCDSAFSGVRIICRFYVDAWGNASDTCCHRIYFSRPQLEEIDFPADTIFTCDNFPGADPSITGVPTWNGVPLYPDRGVCEINISYKDDTLDICPESYKIIREWLVYDWCLPSTGNNPRLEYQVIKIVDEEGPVVYCPTADRHRDTTSSDIWTCTGTYVLPEPIVLDSANQPILDSGAIYIISECSEVSYTVKHVPADEPDDCTPDPNVIPSDKNITFDRRLNRFVATDLPIGCNWFYYTFTDECGNTTQCVFDIYVEDDVPPVAVCDEHTIVSLGIDGTAKVYATSLDDGSWDNCELDTMLVRRMDFGRPCGNDIRDYRNYVEFCCADDGQTRMVEFVVWDASGNSNTCMVEVEVQDKMPPIVTCPPNITVSCDFDRSDLSVFGTIVNARFNQVRKPIVIDDPYVQFSGPALDGEYYDNCIATFRVEEVDSVECGNGEIYRTFIVTDKNGREARCTQVITVRDFEPFEIIPDDWPDNYTSSTTCANDLDLDPSVTGEPRIRNEDCGSIFVGYDDQVFNIEPDACLKVLRKWTVIDWCYYDPNSREPEGVWTHTQVIKITNSIPPTFTSSCDDQEFDLFGAKCTEDIRLTATATDDCTAEEDIRWRWHLDVDNDGIPDTSGTGNDFVITLTAGDYEIWWTAIDQCDNESKCHYNFSVIDKKKPTPYCRTGINTVLMERSMSVTIWAKDFDIASEDNCTAPEDLEFAFLINGVFEPSMTFDCNDLGIQTIRMYVIDEAGNFDYCETTIDIQDPNNICGTANIVSVGGYIRTNVGDDVKDVTVNLIKKSNNLIKSTTTGADGFFTFDDVYTESSYILEAEKNDKPLNGVSTKDLVLIQRYLLGMQPMANGYQMIAADANNNEEVTAADIAELRKLILGNIAGFRNGQNSWRFVNAGSVPPVHNPFPFNESMNYDNLSSDKMSSNFKAVKIGDINGDAEVNATGNSTRGGGSDWMITIEDREFEAQEWVEVPVYAEAGELVGMQMTLDLQNSSLSVEDVVSGQMDICDECYRIDEGLLTISWYDVYPVELNDKDPIFTLIFRSETSGDLSDALEVTSDVTTAEAYRDIDDVMNVRLSVKKTRTTQLPYALYQNVPNPFTSSTVIGFSVPTSQDVKLTIFDVSGKVHQVLEGHFEKGYHEFMIDSDKLNVEGVLYYQLSAGTYTSTRKMLMLR